MKQNSRLKSSILALLLVTLVSCLIFVSVNDEIFNSSRFFTFLGQNPIVPFFDSENKKLNSDDTSADYLLKEPHEPDDESNVEEEDASYDPAPRTTDIPYNQIDLKQRYFLYSPSGGLSNQLIEIAYALEICRLLNRTLYVPMIGRHSSGYRSHEALPYSDLFPADRVLEFPRLIEKVPSVPLNMSVVNFAAHFAREFGPDHIRIVFHPYRENWGKSQLLGVLGNEKKTLVYLRGAEMYHPWFAQETTLKSRMHVRFSPALRRKAIDIVNAVFPDRKFNAMHVRLSDYSERWGTFQERTRAITTKALTETFGPNKEKMNRTLPLYLASDEPNNGGFVELKKLFRVYWAQHLPQNLVQDYKNLFPKSRIRYDMLGVLEQLVCAQAIYFSGTQWSTFSENIQIIRRNKAKLFPELLEYKRSQ